MEIFEHWRKAKGAKSSWRLAWFLANEFCKRFYSSHGIAPQVIEHEGLGYYGIQLAPVPCKVNTNNSEPLGRLTTCGDVENWRSGGPGDHGLQTIEMCDKGESTSQIVEKAIHYMNIPPIPQESHVLCWHKRWGASFELCFQIATVLALRHEPETIQIWNHPFHVNPRILQTDPEAKINEHLGAFLFVQGGKELLVAADGRVLDSTNANIWLSYMQGQTVISLATFIEKNLGA